MDDVNVVKFVDFTFHYLSVWTSTPTLKFQMWDINACVEVCHHHHHSSTDLCYFSDSVTYWDRRWPTLQILEIISMSMRVWTGVLLSLSNGELFLRVHLTAEWSLRYIPGLRQSHLICREKYIFITHLLACLKMEVTNS